jgi:hypothetical protein
MLLSEAMNTSAINGRTLIRTGVHRFRYKALEQAKFLESLWIKMLCRCSPLSIPENASLERDIAKTAMPFS